MKQWRSVVCQLACLLLIGCGGSQSTGTASERSAPLAIALVGDSTIEITQGDPFDDPGVTVSGGDTDSPQIKVIGEVGYFPGEYMLTYQATDTLGSTATAERNISVMAPASATLRLEAEDFDASFDTTAVNEGQTYRLDESVDIEPTNDSDGLYNVGWTASGEWLEYVFTVPSRNHYALSSRVAALASGGFVSITVDGKTLAHKRILGTGDWQNWATQTAYLGLLQAGEHRLRVSIHSGLFNLNWLALEPVSINQVPTSEPSLTGEAVAAMMGLGVNVGQVFESIGANPPLFDPVRAKIDAYYNLGFRTFRLPVTWTAAIERRALVADATVGQVDTHHPRLAVIRALIDYVLSFEDTIIILNAHHEESIKNNQASRVLQRLWADIALVFKDRSHRLIYELLNEPHDSNGGPMPAEVLRDMSRRAYDEIRDVDPQRIIVISANQWGAASELQVTWPNLEDVGGGLDPYLMATFHHYEPWAEFHSQDAVDRAYPFTEATIRAPMQTADEWRNQLGVDLPIYIGEWGVGWGKQQTTMDCNNIRFWYQSLPEAAQVFDMPTQVWDDGGWFEIFNYGNSAFTNNLAQCITGDCDWQGSERFNSACYP